MNADHLDRLMNGEIDGANSAAESRELADLLRADPAARRRFEELKETVSVFRRVGLLEPPDGLRESIAAAVAAEPVRPLRPRRALREALGPAWRPRRTLAFAAGLVLGLGLAGLAWQLEDGAGGIDRHDLLGSVLPESVAPALVSFGTAEPAVSGSWRARREGDRVLLRLELETAAPARAVIQAGAGAVCLGYLDDSAVVPRVQIGGARVELTGLGPGHHDLLFRQDPEGPLTFATEIDVDGAVIDRSSFTVGRGRDR